jgi:iron complex outermembrane receptor protein
MNPATTRSALPLGLPLTAIAFALSSIFILQGAVYAQSEPVKNQEEGKQKEEKSVINEEGEKRNFQRKSAAPKEVDAKNDQVQKVVVNGSKQSDVDLRRNSIAGKIIVGREELDRDGDATVGEILKRLPGVTTGGRPGRGGDIRMRGMGGGYTQILLNGERPPRGFSMESLSPDQVERIEIMRGPVAEFSTQAIAGTINIVLREEYHAKDTDLKFSLGFEQDRVAPNLSLTYPGQIGELNYAISGSIFRNRQHDETVSHKVEEIDADHVNTIQDQFDQTNRSSTGIHFTPRFSYKFENGDTFTLQPFLMNSRSLSFLDSSLTRISNLPPQASDNSIYSTAKATSNSESTMGRMNANYQHKFEDASKVVIKFGAGLGHSNSDSYRTQYDLNGVLLDTITDVNNTRDTSWTTGGKYTTPIGDKQNLATGWEMESGKRNQTRVSLDNGRAQFADSGDNLDAGTHRTAAYIQDEFDINAKWSAYAGVRWESIKIHSTKANYVVDNSSSVVNPIVHAVYRIPDWGKDQIRLGLTSSYRAPALNDIIAVPSISPLNSPIRPDRTGNPDLKPELSRGVDIAYEHYLKSAGIMSANFFVRSIDDLIRRRTLPVTFGSETRYVSSPINIGHALAKGIELEAKFQLQEFYPDGPAIDMRSNYSRFWSSVDDVPGPNNRLDQQPKQTANLGADYHIYGAPLTLGGNVNWTPAYTNQTSATETASTGIKRQLDVYGLWKFSSSVKLRLSASNLQASDFLNGNTAYVNGINYLQNSRSKTYTVFNLRLELKI